MNGQAIAAIITSATAFIGAITALIIAIKGSNKINDHITKGQ